MIDELYLYSYANEPNKSHGEKGSGPFSFERSATFPPQADHVLVDLFFIRGGQGCCVKAPQQVASKCTSLHVLQFFPTT